MNGESEPIPSELTGFSEEEEAENDQLSAPKAGKGIPNFWLSVLKQQVRLHHLESPNSSHLIRKCEFQTLRLQAASMNGYDRNYVE